MPRLYSFRTTALCLQEILKRHPQWPFALAVLSGKAKQSSTGALFGIISRPRRLLRNFRAPADLTGGCSETPSQEAHRPVVNSVGCVLDEEVLSDDDEEREE